MEWPLQAQVIKLNWRGPCLSRRPHTVLFQMWMVLIGIAEWRPWAEFPGCDVGSVGGGFLGGCGGGIQLDWHRLQCLNVSSGRTKCAGKIEWFLVLLSEIWGLETCCWPDWRAWMVKAEQLQCWSKNLLHVFIKNLYFKSFSSHFFNFKIFKKN